MMTHYLLLYAQIEGTVYLLPIRHQRQLSFDFHACGSVVDTKDIDGLSSAKQDRKRRWCRQCGREQGFTLARVSDESCSCRRPRHEARLVRA